MGEHIAKPVEVGKCYVQFIPPTIEAPGVVDSQMNYLVQMSKRYAGIT